ncbi:MAG: hypothetical protein RLZZ524_1717, partial [Pseudomonadota bacterium]
MTSKRLINNSSPSNKKASIDRKRKEEQALPATEVQPGLTDVEPMAVLDHATLPTEELTTSSADAPAALPAESSTESISVPEAIEHLVLAGSPSSGTAAEPSHAAPSPASPPPITASVWATGAALSMLGGAVLAGLQRPIAAPPAASPAPEGTQLTLSVTLGPVLATADLAVDIHDASGKLLRHVSRFTPDANGQMVVDLGVKHSGPVLVRVYSVGAQPDYYDEAGNRDAALTCDVRAIVEVGAGQATAHVHPYSEVLVRQVLQDTGGSAGKAPVVLPADFAQKLAAAKDDLAAKIGLSRSQLDEAPVTVVDARGAARTGNALGVALAALSGLESATGQATSQVIDRLLQADTAAATQLLLVGAASDEMQTLQALSGLNPTVEAAFAAGLPAQTVAQLPVAAIANIPASLLTTGTLLRLSPQQAGALTATQQQVMSPAQQVAIQVAKGEVVLNTPPVRSSGALPVFEAVSEDSAATVALELGLGNLAYAPGSASTEAAQTLRVVITDIPSFLTLVSSNGQAVVAGSSLSLDELKSLRYQTVADASGSGHIAWTVIDSGPSGAPHANSLTERYAVSITPLNDAPVRVSGPMPSLSLDEDGAKDVPLSLGLRDLTYTPGGGADEAAQTLSCRIVAIPGFVTLWKADGTEVIAGTSLTVAELRGLSARTVAEASGTGDIVWTVTDSGSRGGMDANMLLDSMNVSVRTINDAPTLSAIATITGYIEDVAGEITYAQLAAAADEVDMDGDAIGFRVEAISSGSLQKWTGSAWVDVVAGTTVVNMGEKLQWKAAAEANGTLNAFTVKAYDGTVASATAVQVKATVTAVNDTPTLTAISTLSSFTEDTAGEITYAQLVAAADEADIDGDTLSFQIEAISTGTLKKWDGAAWSAVTAGTTRIGTGEKLQWTAAADANGTLDAFTVKAYDGMVASATAVQVQATVTAGNDAPTLTAISTLSSFTEDTAGEITYAQ